MESVRDIKETISFLVENNILSQEQRDNLLNKENLTIKQLIDVLNETDITPEQIINVISNNVNLNEPNNLTFLYKLNVIQNLSVDNLFAFFESLPVKKRNTYAISDLFASHMGELNFEQRLILFYSLDGSDGSDRTYLNLSYIGINQNDVEKLNLSERLNLFFMFSQREITFANFQRLFSKRDMNNMNIDVIHFVYLALNKNDQKKFKSNLSFMNKIRLSRIESKYKIKENNQMTKTRSQQQVK